MLRDRALQPLSRQHQHALALCVRITRASDEELTALREEALRLFDHEIRFHFEAEERVIFPAAERFAELRQLVDDLRRDHVGLRAALNPAMTPTDMRHFAAQLSTHVRREERELFEGMQERLGVEELARLGHALDSDFARSGLPGSSCDLRR